MLQFLVRRLIVALLVAATVMTLAFILTRLSGDLAISIAGPNATQADVEAVRKAYGLDRPLTTQFFDWVGRAVTGDLGESYFFKTPVAKLIGERMPVTITLGLTGLVIALLVSLPLVGRPFRVIDPQPVRGRQRSSGPLAEPERVQDRVQGLLVGQVSRGVGFHVLVQFGRGGLWEVCCLDGQYLVGNIEE